MGIDSYFIHRCTIERPTVVQQDAYNNDVAQFAAVATDISCRLVMRAQKMVSDDRTQFVVVTSYKLFVPGNADVREGDQIASLTLEDGTEAGTFSVAAILPRRSRAVHHITLELEKVT